MFAETVVPAMRELGVGLVPYSPLGRGFLTGTVDVTTLTEGDFRRMRCGLAHRSDALIPYVG